MTRRTPIALLLAWLGLATVQNDVAHAADASVETQRTGAIAGRVSNAATQVFLEGALVSVAGTQLTTITDREGRFELAGLAAGPVTLDVNYTGLTPQRVPVLVTAGQKVTPEIKLGSEIYVMDQFKVAGIRE